MRASSRLPVALASAVIAVSGCVDEPPVSRPVEDGPRPLTAGDTPLGAGRYVTEDFARPLSFTVEEDSWAALQEERAIVTLIGRETQLVFAAPTRVFEKRKGLVPRIAPLPEDFVDWLLERPDLAASDPRPVALDGRQGRTLQVEVREVYEEAELLGCPLPCFPIAPAALNEPLFLTHTHRVLVFDGARPLVIAYSTGSRTGEEAARRLLDTVRFGPDP